MQFFPPLRHLPATLPDGEPYYYLSDLQRQICGQYSVLRPLTTHLPCWVPHRQIAVALGYSDRGIRSALERLGGQPYVWATEFENVHTFWEWKDKPFSVNGVRYHSSEDFYQAQKPRPYNDELWLTQRDQVMWTAITHKFSDPDLHKLLLSTGQHPLLSIKNDAYWGVLPSGNGSNQLARMLMALRHHLQQGLQVPTSPP